MGIIIDGDALAIQGEHSALEHFLEYLEIPSGEARGFRPRVSTAAALAADAPTIRSAVDPRWVRLTADSAEKLAEYGAKSTKDGLISGIPRERRQVSFTSLEHLTNIAADLRHKRFDTRRETARVAAGTDELRHWLGLLAVSLVNQTKFEALEINHLAGSRVNFDAGYAEAWPTA